MKHPVYIPTYNRASTIQTHKLLDADGIDYRIVVHNEEQRGLYLANPSIDPARLLVSAVPYGLCQQRQWILDQIPEGDWVVMLDDNIRYFAALEEPWYWNESNPVQTDKRFGKRFRNRIDAQTLLAYLEKDMERADSIGAHLIAMDQTGNYFFRPNKYLTVSYCIGKAICVKKGPLRYDLGLQSIDDFDFTAQNLLVYGCVLVNKYIYPVAGHYEPGGLGTYDERLRKRLDDCAYIMGKYPGLFRYKAIKDHHPQQDLALRFYDQDRLEAWRESMGH